MGLSIGSSSIKLAELKKTGKTWKLLHFGIVQLPEDTIVNHDILNSVVVTESIKTLANQMKLKSKQVCTGLAGNALIIKRMTLEVPNLRELQDQVFWEAEQYLPFDISEVVMDYHVVSRNKEGQTDIVLVAVKKGILDSYMNCITNAGLKPSIVDVDFFALQNLFEVNYPVNASEAIAVIDLGASSLKTIVVSGGIPVYTKDTLMGGRLLTSEIQKTLNLSYNDAETLKVGGGEGGTPQEVTELMTVMAENLANEIKKGLDFYHASSSGPAVTSVLLSGGTSKIPGLSGALEQQLGVPTQVLNPFNAVSFDPAVFSTDYITRVAPIAAVPIGLALRSGMK